MEIEARAEDFASADDMAASASPEVSGAGSPRALRDARPAATKAKPQYSSIDTPSPSRAADPGVKSFIFDTKSDIGMTLNEGDDPGVWVIDAVAPGGQAAAHGLTVGSLLLRIGTKVPPKDPASLSKVLMTLQRRRSKIQFTFQAAGTNTLFRRRPSFTLYQYDV